MIGSVQGGQLGTAVVTPQTQAGNDPKMLARQILAETGGQGMKYDRLGQIEARLDSIERNDPQLAADVRREIMDSPALSTVDKATLARNAPGQTIDIGGGKAVRTTEDGMDLDRWINIQRRDRTPEYAQLVKVAGSDDNGAIKAVMQEAAARGISVDQLATARLNEGQGSGVDAALIADITQMTLDITGIFDPTPISDGSNVVISGGRAIGELFSGNWSDAGGHGLNMIISGVGFIPYVGDLAKAGKLGKWAETIAKAVDLAISNPAARKALEPALKKLHELLSAVPESVMSKLPDDVKSTLQGIKGKLDELFGAGTKAFSDAVVKTAERLGIPPEKVQSILDTPKGQRPHPSTYMTKEQISAHLAKFDEGAVRFGSRESYNEYGTIGPAGGFVLSRREFERVMETTNGDLRKVETMLGLEKGYLDDANTMVTFIEKKDFADLRMPSGNEGGANSMWLPGGMTSGGVVEAVMDFPKGTSFKEVDIRGGQ